MVFLQGRSAIWGSSTAQSASGSCGQEVHIVYQLCPFLKWDTFQMLTNILITFWLEYCNKITLYMVLPLKIIKSYSWCKMNNLLCPCVIVAPWTILVAIVSFWIKWKVLVVNYKALYGTGTGQLQDLLFPIISIYPVQCCVCPCTIYLYGLFK